LTHTVDLICRGLGLAVSGLGLVFFGLELRGRVNITAADAFRHLVPHLVGSNLFLYDRHNILINTFSIHFILFKKRTRCYQDCAELTQVLSNVQIQQKSHHSK